MASNELPPGTSLEDVMSQLRAIQHKQDELLAVVDSMSNADTGTTSPTVAGLHSSPLHQELGAEDTASRTATPTLRTDASPMGTTSPTQSGFTSRIVLT